MRVNRASMLFGLLSNAINQRLGHFDAYSKYWPPI
jgi:hypothetical protein